MPEACSPDLRIRHATSQVSKRELIRRNAEEEPANRILTVKRPPKNITAERVASRGLHSEKALREIKE